METVTCCERNGMADCGCRQGRDCPENRHELPSILTRRLSPEEMTRRQQEAELRWQCRDQMGSRQFAAHAAAGEFPLGYEAADPAHREPVRVAREPLPVSFASKEPTNWPAVARWGAAAVLCVLWTALVIYAR